MKLPLSWLKDFVDIDVDPKELSDKLLGVGFEVEEIIFTGENIENVVTGRITEIEKHPSADKLQICTVDLGSSVTTIVTAATNISVGDCVPVALDDSHLPTGKHIVASPLRGVMSYGMFCSGSELMIDDSVIEGAEVNGILILPKNTELGKDIKEVLGLNEYVLDISIPANRSDCQSIYGISREIAALYGKTAIKPCLEYAVVPANGLNCPGADVIDKDVCSLYTGTLIRDVKIEKSPKWMRDRLRNVGIRSINNIVDITNYVLIEIGQPLHAFDTRLIDERIVVRRAANGEKIVALDGETYELNDSMLVIADAKKPIAIAGVMGGEYSGINDDTNCVFLEAARFAKESVRCTSRALGLRSDSSARYEKGVDWQSVETGRARALALFDKLGAGKVTELCVSDGVAAPEVKIIETSATKINDLFGITVPLDTMVNVLTSLEFGVVVDGDKLTCTVPMFREDIDNFTDIAEEIIRYYGYEELKSDLIKDAHPTQGGLNVRQRNVNEIKRKAVALGMYECCTYSFINPKQFDKLHYAAEDKIRNVIKLLNPLSEEFSVMRTQLVGSILNVVYTNQNKKNGDFRVFEIAKTYLPKNGNVTVQPDEHETLCFAFSGANESFYGVKGAVEALIGNLTSYTIARSNAPYLHPGISADIIVDGNIVGSFGKLHPVVADEYDVTENVFVAQIDMDGFIANAPCVVEFRPLPKFPVVDRDLAIVVNEDVAVGELVSCIKSSGAPLVESVELFDVYRGEQIEKGFKSVAFNLKLRSDEGTLVDSQIQDCIAAVLDGVAKNFDAKLR